MIDQSSRSNIASTDVRARRGPWLNAFAIISLMPIAWIGCGSNTPSEIKPPARPTPQTEASASEATSQTASKSLPTATEDEPLSAASNPTREATSPEATTSTSDNPAERSSSGPSETPVTSELASSTSVDGESIGVSSPERILILLPHGPVIVDCHFLMNSQPYQDVLAKRLQSLFALADKDHDGQLPWRELLAHDAFQEGQFGNPATPSEEERKAQIYRCDLNRDGRVQIAELQLFLAPENHGGHRLKVDDQATRLLTTNDAIFTWLDADQDGRLSIREQQACRQRLMLLDVNDDGVLEAREVPTTTPTSTGSARSQGATSLVWLHEETDWSAALFLLEERYAFGSPLQASDFPSRADLFERLDADHDGSWSLAEWKTIQDAPADLQVWFSLDHSAPLRIEPLATTTAPITVDARGPSIRLELASSRVILSGPESREDVWETEAFTQAFTDADTDSDRVLNEEEYMPLGALTNLALDVVDGDDDGHVSQIELASAIERREGVARLLMTLTSNRRSSPLISWLDGDDDGQLGERELAECQAKLTSVADSPRPLALSDFPTPLRIEFARGSAAATLNLPSTANIPDTARQESARRDWFEQTDRNGDGELSRREFLGSPQLFDQLDLDQDGFVTRRESSR